jgi:hypothetical protein
VGSGGQYLRSFKKSYTAQQADFRSVVFPDGEKDTSDNDDKDDDVEMEEQLTVVTPESINELSAQNVQIAGKVKKYKCDKNEFDNVASKLTDVNTSLRRLAQHSRYERNRVRRNRQKHHDKHPWILSSGKDCK